MNPIPIAVRKLVSGTLVGIMLVLTPAHADPMPNIPRIGVLIPPANWSLEEGLRDGLRGLGYIEGQNIVIEWRRSAGTTEELRSLATDLAHSKVNVIVASGSPAARAALGATTMPVVFLVGDPVGSGFAASLARPGGNGTGLSVLSTELYPKRLEFLHQLAPRARRIVFLMNSSNPAVGTPLLDATQKAARTLGVQIVTLDARNAGELDAALRAIPRSAADGILVAADLFFLANKSKIALAVRKAKLPAMFPLKEYHEDGALMSYGANYKDAMLRAARYVDKILKGAKPSELPIEQVSKYELIIDLRVAHELGIEVPQALLARADEVIR